MVFPDGRISGVASPPPRPGRGWGGRDSQEHNKDKDISNLPMATWMMSGDGEDKNDCDADNDELINRENIYCEYNYLRDTLHDDLLDIEYGRDDM